MTESRRKYIRGGLAAAFAIAALPLASASAQAADYDVGSIHHPTLDAGDPQGRELRRGLFDRDQLRHRA